MNELLLINKDKNYTSRDVVNIISKKFNTKKVGHFGTLDPLATGLLVIGIWKNDTVVSVVTGNGLKDVANAIKACGDPISIPSDMDLLLKAFKENGIEVEA